MGKTAELLKRPALPPLRKKSDPPLKASELVKRRAAEAQRDFERATDKRENMLQALVRQNAKVWQLARRVKDYERKLQMMR